MEFSENTRVQIPAAIHLCKLGYEYLCDIENYDKDTNILTDIFLENLLKLNPSLSINEAKNYLAKIKTCLNNDDLGREFYSMLCANSGIKMIDFETPENNAWHITTEFSCKNHETDSEFRPDISCFINGLPLCFIEVKKPNNSYGIKAEYDRANSRFKNKAFRRFLNATQLMIFSNNQEYAKQNLNASSNEPIQGAFYCCTAKENGAFYNMFREGEKNEGENNFAENYPYKEISDHDIKKILRHRNCLSLIHHPDFQTNNKPNTPTNKILTSMLSKERFLFLLRYGFAYVDKSIELEDKSKTKILEKHIMRYQQFFALKAILKKLESGAKSGIIWHTQGSGKTALAFYATKAINDFFAKQNIATKFYFIVDRIDLKNQTTNEFESRGLFVRSANSRDELMADFRSNNLVENKKGALEIMVVNIQKFKEDHTPIKLQNTYSTRLQRIFFIDEAHRGYNPKGSFLANLFEADRDSIKIAMTGTPLLKDERESWRVFGDYIHTYYYDKSIADGYTLKLMREPITTIYKEKIESIIDKIASDIKVKKSDIDKDKILEHPNYLNALIEYIQNDLSNFRVELDDKSIAAMVVCKTNSQARKFYELWCETSPKTPLKAALILHDEGEKIERERLIYDFKQKQTIDVLIVNQMLLTGFDAPRLKKLYLGRILDGHDLLQALTRVNRPYKNLRYGYVVDFVDIKENFEATNERYLKELNRTNDDETKEIKSIAECILESEEEIEQKISDIKSTLWHYDTSNLEEFRKQIDDLEKPKLYDLKATLEDAKALINRLRTSGDKELLKRLSDIPNGYFHLMLNEVTRRIALLNYAQNLEHNASITGILNLAMNELEFEFKKGMPEELKIAIGDFREKYEATKREFDANFDQKGESFVSLADEFKAFFRKKGYVPKSIQDAKDMNFYLDEVMKKIKEINKINQTFKRHYKNDEKFVRVHNRLQEQNAKRQTPFISKNDIELCEKLCEVKNTIDERVELNEHILLNETAFRQDVMSFISKKFYDMNIQATIDDKNYLTNLISSEYIAQYESF